MMTHGLAPSRRQFLRSAVPGLAAGVLGLTPSLPLAAQEANLDLDVRRAIDRGLRFLDSIQARGRWEADGGMYPVAMTALAGMTFLLDGNTTLQGRYARNVQDAVGYIVQQAQPNGLIGHPERDSRYMYGHGFSMLFLAQVLGEEEDVARREELIVLLTKAVRFCGQAQTNEGGWGYVSARDGRGFDEGSVTITQMQGLRACRNAGIPVPKEIVEKGVDYIRKCTDDEGGVRYSLKTSGGARPPITGAAVACLFNAGEYDDPLSKKLIAYADKTLFPDGPGRNQSYGHWHYAHYYYSQVCYQQGDEKWGRYRRPIFEKILKEQQAAGNWDQGYIGTVYTTSLNLSILQIDNGYLPIYER